MNKKTNLKPKIGCDVGGVLSHLQTEQPIPGSLEGLAFLEKEGFPITFVSKCGDSMRQRVKAWLADKKLSHHPVYFCYGYDGKFPITKEKGIEIMIDDRIQVLRTFPLYSGVKCLWFTRDEHEIQKVARNSPQLFAALVVVRNWEEVVRYILDYAR